MRRRGKVDANHAAIVRRFREWGWTVQSLADIGGGCPDLLVSSPRGDLVLAEVKMPKQEPNALQEAWYQKWPSNVLIVRGLSDVDALCRAK